MDRVCFHRDKREHCGDYRLPWLTMFFISHGSRCYRRFFIRDRKYTCHVKNQMWRAVYRPQPHHTYCSPAGVPIIPPALIPSAISQSKGYRNNNLPRKNVLVEITDFEKSHYSHDRFFCQICNEGIITKRYCSKLLFVL